MGEITNTVSRNSAEKMRNAAPNVNHKNDISVLKTIRPRESNYLKLKMKRLRKSGIRERQRAGNELRNS